MNFSQLVTLASGHVDARIAQTAVELAIFDALEDLPLTAQETANRLGLEVRATELLLNALASMNLLQKRINLFSLTPIAKEYLVKSSPQYLGGMIRFDASLWGCWERLSETIRSGRPARPPDMYQDNPSETETFIAAMDSLVKARGDAEVIAGVLDWNSVTTVLDIGSGPATYPIFLCRRFRHIQAAVFDLPGTLELTERYVSQAGMSERIKLIAGDYRCDPVPGGYDVIFLSNIIHGENMETNERLVRSLAGNLNQSGQIVIKDHILDETRITPPVGAIFSLLMLLTTEGGRCYSFAEIRRWLELAGLNYVRQIDLPAPLTSSLVIGNR
jgi:SAM-dependent methyltransferase